MRIAWIQRDSTTELRSSRLCAQAIILLPCSCLYETLWCSSYVFFFFFFLRLPRGLDPAASLVQSMCRRFLKFSEWILGFACRLVIVPDLQEGSSRRGGLAEFLKLWSTGLTSLWVSLTWWYPHVVDHTLKLIISATPSIVYASWSVICQIYHKSIMVSPKFYLW